ncbi:condensation domain-containing protein [Streptomyces sp. CB02115]|uniref:condensation domain-containing protein n=1 Tax=Streptomyces sp. CB02115 TaxID=1703939 RepID=UPI001300CB44|nr:condensation domain-containing protein [Streptomyces sp. CB02115]
MPREQEAIWINDALSEGRSCYTVLWAHRLRGAVAADAVEGALPDVIERRESLRSRFLMEGGVPVQRVTVTSGSPVVRERVTEADLGERLAALAAEPLDPADGPLRPTLLRLSDDDWVLAVLSAAPSGDRRLVAGLPGTGVQPLLPSPAAAGHRRRGPSATAAARRLRARPAQHPAERGRPPAPDGAVGGRAGPQHDPVRPAPARRAEYGQGARIAFRLDEDVTSAVRRFARAARTTPFTVLTAAAVALLHRHGTGDGIVVGTPVSRRGNAGLDSVMGCLTDLMPPRFTVGADLSFRDLVRSARSEVLDLVRHRGVPSGELIRRTATAGQLGRFPLFQTVAQVNDSPSPG